MAKGKKKERKSELYTDAELERQPKAKPITRKPKGLSAAPKPAPKTVETTERIRNREQDRALIQMKEFDALPEEIRTAMQKSNFYIVVPVMSRGMSAKKVVAMIEAVDSDEKAKELNRVFEQTRARMRGPGFKPQEYVKSGD